MRKVWNWVRKYLWIPLLFVIATLAWLLWRKKTPLAQTKAELRAIRAGARAEEMEARSGTEAAKKLVELLYRDELEALDERQSAKAEELRHDPAKLARFLVRVGSRGP